MVAQPDAYAIWGDWDLEQFKVQFARWRDADPHSPAESVTCVNQWWKRLKQPMEWSSAARVSASVDFAGTLRWMWIPEASWIDEQRGYFRVQCYFRVLELDRPPRLVCQEFRTVQWMTPAGVDRAGGMS